MNEPSKNYCPRCHKLITPIRKGSLTSWILGGFACSCTLRNTVSTISRFGIPSIAHDEDIIPEINNRYKAEDLIEKTGMSFIYKAWDLHLEKHCVVKLIRAELAAYPQANQRFTAEARLCARFVHPNLVPVTDYGVTDTGLPFLVMDLIDGSSLRALLDSKQKLSVNESLSLVIEMCKGLQYAHNLSVIHRDLKPENILIEFDDTGCPIVKIIDFGIAKIDQHGGEVQRLTQTGEVFGSAVYMSPEQCAGTSVDRRVDIYALGCIMYELLSGHPPFRGSTLMDVLNKQLNDSPRPLTNVDGKPVPKGVNDVVIKCLSKNPEDRFETAIDLQRALEKQCSFTPAPQAVFLASTLALVTVVSIAVFAICGILLRPVNEPTNSRLVERTLLAALAERRNMPDLATKTYLALAKSQDLPMLSDSERYMVSLLIINHLYTTQRYKEAMKFFGSLTMSDTSTLKVLNQRDNLIATVIPMIYSYIGRTEDRSKLTQSALLKFKKGIKLASDLDSPKWVKGKLMYDLGYVLQRDKLENHGQKEFQGTINLITAESDGLVGDCYKDLMGAATGLDNQMTAANREADATTILLKVISRVQNLNAIPADAKVDLVRRLIKHYEKQGMTKEVKLWQSELSSLEQIVSPAQN